MTAPDEPFYRALVRSVGFVLVAADRGLSICCWNDQAARVFGGHAEQVLGTPILNVFPAERRAAVAQLFREVLDHGTSHDIEFKHVGPAGRRQTFVAILSPVLGPDGGRIGVSVAMRDITQRKQLAQQVATGRRLASLGRMASAVAHHFNNILGGILSSIETALLSDNPRTIRKTLEGTAESVGRASRITSQLLAFSESEHAVGQPIDLNDAVAAFVETIRPQLTRRGMTLDAVLRPVAPTCFESHHILPVLESVAQNSIDAMQTGGRLAVRLEQQQNEAVVVLEDTGCGIPPEHVERLFEPFFTTKGQLGGGESDNVGLGLAAVHGLVAEIGGRIELTSQVGQGTRVTIRLPLAGPAQTRP